MSICWYEKKKIYLANFIVECIVECIDKETKIYTHTKKHSNWILFTYTYIFNKQECWMF